MLAENGMREFQQLLEHMVWADERVLASLRVPAPPGPVVGLLAHLLGAEEVWLARLEQRPTTTAVWPALSVENCAALASRNRAGYEALLRRLTPADLERPIAYTSSAGQSFTSTRGEILLQVFLHGAYHRGQISTLLRAASLTPAPTDFIALRRGAPAATRQPPRAGPPAAP